MIDKALVQLAKDMSLTEKQVEEEKQWQENVQKIGGIMKFKSYWKY
ncbi:MAG: hypothetical protein LBS29_01910 [Endomicrobium sp.]|jgi:hypothetical protein|nr:hypothetical protein [Endomicrobium sp.]